MLCKREVLPQTGLEAHDYMVNRAIALLIFAPSHHPQNGSVLMEASVL